MDTDIPASMYKLNLIGYIIRRAGIGLLNNF